MKPRTAAKAGAARAIRSDRERVLRQAMRAFVDEEVTPRAAEIDALGEFPWELFRALGDMGAFGLRYPREAGGAGGTTTLYCAVCEELARGLVSLAAEYAMQGLMGTNFIFHHGAPEHREEYFRPAMRGEKVAAFCMTEPDAASDLAACKTTAARDGEDWIVNGLKSWVTNGPVASFYTVLVQTNPGAGLKGLAFVLVDRDRPGVSVSRKFDLVGTRSTEICEVAFTDVVVRPREMLVPPGRGVAALMGILGEIRAMTGAIGLGLARAALEASVRYARERCQFGKPIAEYQMIQSHLARVAVNVHAAELMVRDCCQGLEAGRDMGQEAMMTKYFACETACQAAETATRVMGAYSYSMEYPVQRFWRDTRFLLYGGGTHEILQVNIGRGLLK